MSVNLTPKQEAFCQSYIETGNASEAYRNAYDAQNMRPATINRNAKFLLDDNKIATRIAQLKAIALERHKLTVDDIIRELEEARAIAMTGEKPQASAMVAATLGKAKVLGLITDKQEVTGKDGGPINHSLTVSFVKPK